MKGKLLIAQSRKEKKEEELKAFFYPMDLKEIQNIRGLFQEVA